MKHYSRYTLFTQYLYDTRIKGTSNGVYTQFTIYWLDPPNTNTKQICLQIYGNGGICKISRTAKQRSNPQRRLGEKIPFNPNIFYFKYNLQILTIIGE